jgi:hypothetical protein
MKLLKQSTARDRAGFVLLIVLIMLGIMIAVFATVLSWSSNHATLTRRNNLFNISENAAESCTENVLTHMMNDFTFSSLGSSNIYNTLIPPTNGWPVLFNFTGTNGSSATTATVIINSASQTNLTGTYAGLYGFVQQCQIASTATPIGQGYNNLSATVNQTVQFAQIPLFQFGIFYNLDLEINPSSTFGIGGSVWCNGNIYNSPNGLLVYFAPVYATGNVYNNRDHPYDSTANGSGAVIYSTAYYTNTGPTIHEDTLTMPVGNGNNSSSNVNSILQLPATNAAPSAGAYTAAGQLYLYNASDLVISNPATGGLPVNQGTNITVYYQNQHMATPFTQVPGDVPIYTNIATHTTNYTYSFVTNATFYDYRENKTVNAIQIDVAAFNRWLTNSSARGGLVFDNDNNVNGTTTKGHHIWSIYAYNSVSMTGSTLPGVRVKNGQLLPPSGLTISTPDPMYVMGDYNIMTNYNAPVAQQSRTVPDATYTLPAALMCDAITVISTNYSDTPGIALSSRTPITQHGDGVMTVNAAILTGIVPSANGYYSGGVENLIRLLENWPAYPSSSVLNTGSQVAMFASLFATNHYVSPGTYFNAPGYDEGFDRNYLNYSQLPPLTPSFNTIARAGWQMY